jgi:hypothetical protein
MSQPLLDFLALVGSAAAVLVDGRWAVALATFAAAGGLLAAAATIGGGPAALFLAGAFAAAAVTAWSVRWLASHLGRSRARMPGRSSPQRREALFGPRSLRLIAAAVALPAASWVSFNVPVGSVTVVEGRLFPVVIVFAIGAVRLLIGRNPTDLAIGVALVAVAVSVAWLLRGGPDPIPAAAGVAAFAPAAAAVEAWVSERRPGEVRELRR